MKIVIAPNAFKNALTADAVAEALRHGMVDAGFTGEVICCPVGDGGDGTGDILRKHLNAQHLSCKTVDALGRPVEAGVGITDDGQIAIIEMADASGLRLLKTTEYHPLKANTAGTGFLIKAALKKGVRKIILCIGGSATVDGGTGMMQALGLKFLDGDGNEIRTVPSGLLELKSIDASGLDERLREVEIEILCDVKNKLLGDNGAAAVFGPQKGASDADVVLLNDCLTKLDTVVQASSGKRMSDMPHSGAAGGMAAILMAFCQARAVDGITSFLDLVHFDDKLKGAGLVITGEGAIDKQTLDGKAPYGVALAAGKMNIPVIGVAGRVEDPTHSALEKYFKELICINGEPVDLATALKRTRSNLEKTGRDIISKIKKYS